MKKENIVDLKVWIDARLLHLAEDVAHHHDNMVMRSVVPFIDEAYKEAKKADESANELAFIP